MSLSRPSRVGGFPALPRTRIRRGVTSNFIRRTASKPDSISVVGKYGRKSAAIPNAFSSHCSSREIQTTRSALASCFTSISSAFATESLPTTRSV